MELPPEDMVQSSFMSEIQRIANREISVQEPSLLDRLASRPEDYRTRNRLGVLYARYGRQEDARLQFEQALESEQYPPALLNLANLAFLGGELESARFYYGQAIDVDPNSTAAILGLARVDFADQRYDEASGGHLRLQTIAPELAEQFSYLAGSVTGSGDTGSRANDAALLAREVIWGE